MNTSGTAGIDFQRKKSAPRGIRTHDTRFKVWGANHYTMGAALAGG